MISEERLKELIEQNGIVWVISNEPNRSIVKVQLYNEHHTVKHNKINEICEIRDTFETKEQAEWARDFQRIKRTEYLNLPSWEEFYKTDNTLAAKFTSNDNILCYLFKCEDEDEIVLQQGVTIAFNEKLTKENYIKACEMAKQLFLGDIENIKEEENK